MTEDVLSLFCLSVNNNTKQQKLGAILLTVNASSKKKTTVSIYDQGLHMLLKCTRQKTVKFHFSSY